MESDVHHPRKPVRKKLALTLIGPLEIGMPALNSDPMAALRRKPFETPTRELFHTDRWV
jgi:hypothetical protein